jgi:CubicO group peptidase (beta-lactamase class C family)
MTASEMISLKPRAIVLSSFIRSSLLLGLIFACFASHAQPAVGNAIYNYVRPKALVDGIRVDQITNADIDSNLVIALTKLILEDSFPNIHSLLIARNNKLVYENYFSGKDERWGWNLGYVKHAADSLHDIRSISKSVVSACIGIAIGQHKINSIDDPIFNYLPGYVQFKNEQNGQITIRHLLTMSSGLKWDEDVPHGSSANNETQMERSRNPVEYVLGLPMENRPGNVWNYNSGGVQVLAEIIRTTCGEKIDDYANEYLFEPLGIKTYTWTRSQKDFPAAASGLRLASRDLLKFAMLYLNNGNWKGRQILSPNWVHETMESQISREKDTPAKGYGFLFWTQIDSVGNKPYILVSAKGNGGQRIFIDKASNLIVVITAGNYNKQGIKNDAESAMKKYILPALK